MHSDATPLEQATELLEATSNMLLGMTMDPAIPVHAKDALRHRIGTLESFVRQVREENEKAEDDPRSYFRLAIGASYRPAYYGKHEASHPVRVKEVFEEVRDTRAGDVIAALAFNIAILEQRAGRMREALQRSAP